MITLNGPNDVKKALFLFTIRTYYAKRLAIPISEFPTSPVVAIIFLTGPVESRFRVVFFSVVFQGLIFKPVIF